MLTNCILYFLIAAGAARVAEDFYREKNCPATIYALATAMISTVVGLVFLFRTVIIETVKIVWR